MKKGKYWVNGEVRWVSENGGRVSMKMVSKDVVSEKKSEVDDDIRYSEDIIRPLRGYLV